MPIIAPDLVLSGTVMVLWGLVILATYPLINIARLTLIIVGTALTAVPTVHLLYHFLIY